MLTITILGQELWDEKTESFLNDSTETVVLEFEHSLLSLSKWESKFEKPFLGKSEKTPEEIWEYIKCMLITPGVSSEVLSRLNAENFLVINRYIDSKQSGKKFREATKKNGPPEIITAELIYYWMITFNIPLACETWHLNRLFSLIRTCSEKNAKPEKRSAREIAQHNHDLNAQRRAQLQTSG